LISKPTNAEVAAAAAPDRDSARAPAREADAVSALQAPEDVLDFSRFPRAREARVRFCLAIMAADRWTKGVTGVEIAKATDVSPSTMKTIAAEAWRRFQAAVDVPLVRQHLAVAMREGVELGIAAARPKVGRYKDGSPKREKGDLFGLTAAAACAKTLAALVGAEAPTKHEVTGKDGAQLIPGTTIILSDLSEEQLQAFVERGEVPKTK
jgi:hypothetical protein